MLKILTDNLSADEIQVIEFMIGNIYNGDYYFKSISDDFSDILDEELSPIIIFASETKAKTFEKKLVERARELNVDFNFLIEKAERFPRPRDFIKQDELALAYLNSIRDMVNKTYSDIKTSVLPEGLLKKMDEIKEIVSEKDAYILEDEYGKRLEIRNPSVKPTIKNSITIDDLTMLMSLRYVFQFDKLNIPEVVNE